MKAPAQQQDAERRPAPTRPAPTRPASTPEAAEPSTGPPTSRPLSVPEAQRLQGAAGNRAVARLVAQRRAATSPTRTAKTPSGRSPQPPPARGAATAPVVPAEPVEVQRLDAGARSGPGADPKFAALKADVRGKQKLLTAHRPPRAEADAAQAAAQAPQDDKQAQGKAANAEKMNAAKPGEFDKAAFIKAVNDAIAAQAPKNLDEADKFGGSGKAVAVKDRVAGQVTEGKKKSAGPIESTTKAPPDTSQAKEKPVTPLSADRPPPQPGIPDPAKAVPDKAPPATTDFSAGPRQVDEQMAQAEVTEEQLAKSNEPEFGDAVAAKKEGEAHAATAPGQVRAAEAQTLAAAKAEAGQTGAAAMAAMTSDRKQTGAALTGGKTAAKGSDEARRAQVTATLQKVFDATKKDVEEILTGLDKKVDDAFTKGEKAARDAFTAEHKRRMDEYKDRRYSGFWGKGRWLKDKFAGLPEEANQIFVQARAGYTARMQQVISSVADLISAELGRAKQRIAQGRDQLKAEVAKLPKDLQALGKQASADFAGKFDELTESVDNKGQELVQTLAGKYKEALDAVDEEIAAEKEKNKGLVAKAVDAVGGAIRTILQLKDLLLGVLAKAASAVMAIIKDPISFLGKLVSAVGAGLHAFMANIGEHLKKGLVGWLIGAMAGAGLQLPATFDLRGILTMIASLLGLTWAAIRGRVVQRGVPEHAMGAVEQSVPVAQKLQSEGIAGIWEDVKEKVGDLKEKLFSKISEYLIPTVLMAGITWIISLLNPASAFIKACKMIVDIVTFIVERGAQIVAFVNAVLDAVIAIAGGAAGGVPALIERALAMSISVLIGALAAILGVGGIAEKVKEIFQSLSKPVMKAVDWVVGKIVAVGKRIWAKLKGGFGGRNTRGKGILKPGQVRAGVKRDLRAQMVSGIMPTRVRAVAAGIYQKWQPKGLKGLDVVSAGANSTKFDVLVMASPRTKIYQVAIDLGRDPATSDEGQFQGRQPFRIDDDIKLDKADATRAQANLSWPAEVDKLNVMETKTDRSGDRFWYINEDGSQQLMPRRSLDRLLGRMKKKRDASNKGVHAEVSVLENIKGNWGALPDALAFKQKFNYDPMCWLQLHVTRSPCPPCADAILEIRDGFAAPRGWQMKVRVSALSLFHVGGESAAGRSAIQKLIGQGVQVNLLELTEAQAKGLLTKNPQLAPKLAAKGAVLAGAIQEARKLAETHLGG